MMNNEFAIEDAALDDPPALIEVSPADRQQECLARARKYRLLAGVFIEEPSAQFLAAFRDSALLACLSEAGVAFEADFLAAQSADLCDALACEYTTLFASSGGFPPVESVRLFGRFHQEPQFQVQRLYAQAGFALKKGRFEVFPDQLGVELLFVAELLERCAAALGEGHEQEQEQEQEFKRLDKQIKRFWVQHLGLWVRGYSRLVSRAANHSFYREMAKFLGGFSQEEIAAMGLKRLEDLDLGREVVPKREIGPPPNPDEPVCGSVCGAGSGAVSGAAPLGNGPKGQQGGSEHILHDLRF